MLTAQRRNKIKEYLLEKKSASVPTMAALFQVSDQTIRRDFEVLEKEGVLSRSYGGALLKDRKAVVVLNSIKSGLQIDEKKMIAQRAVTRLCPNDCIFVDHSTTGLVLCEEIPDIPLTVVTNSYAAIKVLSQKRNLRLISTGGIYQKGLEGFFGLETVRYLEQHCIDKAFISCRSIDLQRGISDADEIIADVHRSSIKNSEETYLLMDNTKIGKSGFITICGLDEINYLITDCTLDEPWHQTLCNNNVFLIEADRKKN